MSGRSIGSENADDRSITLPIPLDGAGRLAYLSLPRDLTVDEAHRVARIVEALGLEKSGAS